MSDSAGAGPQVAAETPTEAGEAGAGASVPPSAGSGKIELHVLESKHIAKRVLFTSRENVNIVHELFRLVSGISWLAGAQLSKYRRGNLLKMIHP